MPGVEDAVQVRISFVGSCPQRADVAVGHAFERVLGYQCPAFGLVQQDGLPLILDGRHAIQHHAAVLQACFHPPGQDEASEPGALHPEPLNALPADRRVRDDEAAPPRTTANATG